MKTSAKKTGKGKKDKALLSSPRESVSDIYGRFTQLVIQNLEEGVVPWKQPWHEMGLPSNYLTKKPYRGINLWVLLAMRHRYRYYLTYKQAQELGGKVRKGAKSIPICYWNTTFRDKEAGKAVPESQVRFPLGRCAVQEGFGGFPKELRTRKTKVQKANAPSGT